MSDASSLSDDGDIIVEQRGRPRKKRKIAVRTQRQESESEEPSNDQSSSINSHKAYTDKAKSDDKENEKPKSRHRIHIPTKADCPSDTFATQVAERSSSPYRIDDFQWRKPAKEVVIVADDRRGPDSGCGQSAATEPDHVASIASAVQRHQSIECGIDDDEFDLDGHYDQLLNDFPQDTWVPQAQAPSVAANAALLPQSSGSASGPTKVAAPQSKMKQTTLFGTQVDPTSNSQPVRKRIWPVANRDEPPTHHDIDRDAMRTWVYPVNLGAIRNYQYSIVAAGLYHNLLVALPTGLGKTFIAATIMLNWFRWTKSAQLVFVAPTKPLVSQQVKACFEIAGIPRSTTTLLTGSTAPGLRAEEWRGKRVFFMTPQTLINDLKSGICDPKRLVLIVIDEAHRATGSYAYVEVVNFVRRFNDSFRVLALTATPGASIESVQEVINGLGISRIEIRTEESIDIRDFVHSRKIDTVHFDNSEEMTMILDLFSKALQPAVDQLTSMNAYWSRDPLSLTPYGCTQARQRWFASDAGRNSNFGLKAIIMNTFSLLASLSHATELLKFHGLGPFYQKVLAFRNQIHAGGKKGDKYSNQINTSEPFQTMMSRLQIWINNNEFIGHPKLQYVQDVAMNHFLDAGEGRGAQDPSATRIMIFAHYRSSAEELVRILKRNEPMIRPHVFVGQSSVKDSEGMDQKTQLEIIQKFKNGIYNTLVATSIGEEGLDIGEVDLIICYDASASPIRMLQRMGRTGRKRAGNIVVTLMNGKESDNFSKAKDNYEKIQREISAGDRFEYHEDTARRIVPRDIQPVVGKKLIEIPYENTQPGLPEPAKRGRPPKRPPKKFHMPDNVRTGFVKASRLDGDLVEPADSSNSSGRGLRRGKSPSPVHIPSLQDVLLDKQDQNEFERQYLDIPEGESEVVKIPALDAAPQFQRTSRPVQKIGHSQLSRSLVHTLSAMHAFSCASEEALQRQLQEVDKQDIEQQVEARAEFFADITKRSTIISQAESADVVLVTQSLTTPNESYPPSASGSSVQNDDELPDIDAIMQERSNTGQQRDKRRAKMPIVSEDSDDE